MGCFEEKDNRKLKSEPIEEEKKAKIETSQVDNKIDNEDIKEEEDISLNNFINNPVTKKGEDNDNDKSQIKNSHKNEEINNKSENQEDQKEENKSNEKSDDNKKLEKSVAENDNETNKEIKNENDNETNKEIKNENDNETNKEIKNENDNETNKEIKNENENDNETNSKIKNENDDLPKTYTNQGEEKNYFLICPDCGKNILKIESVYYQPEKKDFIVQYNCFCETKSPKYFEQILTDFQNSCDIDRNQVTIICEDCKTELCKECFEEHKKHKIKSIINKEVISEEIMAKINEKKDEFIKIDILQKLYEFYVSYKNDEINNIQINIDNVEKSINSNIEILEKKNDNNEEEKRIFSNGSTFNYKNTKTLKGHKDRLAVLIKLSKNNLIATGSYDGTVKIWDITKDENEALIMNKNAIGSVFCLLEFEPGKLLGGTSANMVNLWDLEDEDNQEYIYNFYKHYLWVQALVKCDENHFASASNDTRIIIWDYTNRKDEIYLEGHNDCIMDMIMLKNGYLCTSSADENIRIWDWKQQKCLFFFKGHEKYVKCLCELSNGYLLTGSEDNSIGVWEEKSSSYENIKYIEGHSKSIRTLCQIDNDHFASGSFDYTIKIWNIINWECLQTLKGHSMNVIDIIKFDDNTLISCSNDQTIKIWNNI
jgi:WD40 repeat protein